MVVILVVSDERGIGRHVRSVLGSQGWWVTTANDREEALRAAADHQPGLVVVDCEVEGADELVRTFGSKNGGPGALLLEPAEGAELSFGAFEAGADQILSKPPRAEELLEAAERVMALPHQSGGVTTHSLGDKLNSEDIFGELLTELGGAPTQPPSPRVSPIDPPDPPSEASVPEESGASAAAEAHGALAASDASGPTEADARFDDSVEMTPVEAQPAPELPGPQAAGTEPPLVEEPSNVEPERTEGGAVTAASSIPEDSFADLGAIDHALAASVDAPHQPARPVGGEATAEESPEELHDEVAAEDEASRDVMPEVDPESPPERPELAAELGGGPDRAPVAAEAGDRAPSDAPDDSEETQPAASKPKAPPIAPAPGTEGVRFGQYRLDERIAVGGMAEVWRASMLGVEGFRKTVAIKKILPHLAENDEFVTMFIEEAKLAAQLSHENLVEIYDLGRIGSSFFIAMEYVDGRDLRSLLNRLKQTSQPMPIGMALQIATEVARGLEYAHTRRDSSGESMGLVHRDVSPRNMLIGQDGRVRLCDFGVAKAVSSVIQTEIGALKGKLQYMSPEQASGKAVDARSDIYSLGSVLYEMIAGRRLYEADNEISLLDAVRAGNFDDPRKHCPGLPQEVRRILMKALSKRPSARYQTAGDLERDLRKIIQSLDPSPSEHQLSAFVSDLFAEPSLVTGPPQRANLESAEISVPGTMDSVLEAAAPRTRIAKFWWGVVAGLVAAGLAAGALKLLLG